MQKEIHPQYKDISVVCSCGATFVTRSTLAKSQLSIEICSQCHPFYTGTQKMIDTEGRVNQFLNKYKRRGINPENAEKTNDETNV